MKSGSGDDPFADEESRQEAATENESSDTPGDTSDSTASDTSSAAGGLPWIYARENAKSQREMVQFFLQSETQSLESRAQANLDGLLGEEPLVLDVREAAYQVALEQHLDDVAAKLRDWGYDFE